MSKKIVATVLIVYALGWVVGFIIGRQSIRNPGVWIRIGGDEGHARVLEVQNNTTTFVTNLNWRASEYR